MLLQERTNRFSRAQWHAVEQWNSKLSHSPFDLVIVSHCQAANGELFCGDPEFSASISAETDAGIGGFFKQG